MWCPHLEEGRVQDFMVSSEYFLKSLTELLEIRKSLSWAPENFPPAIFERQVFNLGRVAPGPS